MGISVKISLLMAFGICLLFPITGCGHVSYNFPVHTQSKSVLPEEFKAANGQNTTLVWFEKGRVHGFLSKWRDTSDRARSFWDRVATSGAPVIVETAITFDKLAEQGLAEATIMVFLAKDIVLPCNTGIFEVEFDDGTQVRDNGVLYVERRDAHDPYHFSENGKLFLKREIGGKENPIQMILLLPNKFLNRQIVKVTYLTPNSM